MVGQNAHGLLCSAWEERQRQSETDTDTVRDRDTIVSDGQRQRHSRLCWRGTRQSATDIETALLRIPPPGLPHPPAPRRKCSVVVWWNESRSKRDLQGDGGTECQQISLRRTRTSQHDSSWEGYWSGAGSAVPQWVVLIGLCSAVLHAASTNRAPAQTEKVPVPCR